MTSQEHHITVAILRLQSRESSKVVLCALERISVLDAFALSVSDPKNFVSVSAVLVSKNLLLCLV